MCGPYKVKFLELLRKVILWLFSCFLDSLQKKIYEKTNLLLMCNWDNMNKVIKDTSKPFNHVDFPLLGKLWPNILIRCGLFLAWLWNVL